MFTRQTTQVTVEVKDGNDVVKTFTFDKGDSSKVTVEVSLETKLPSRSPLHPNALNFEDLKSGLNIQRNNTRGNSYRSTGIIVGEPFKRGSKFGNGDSLAHVWMVPVVTANSAGKLALEAWYLSDMGVVPSERPDGTLGRWNEQNYTLAVG